MIRSSTDGNSNSRRLRAVREHEILRVAATLVSSRPEAAEEARREVLKWVEKRSGGLLPPEAWSFQDYERFSGGRDSVGVRIQNDALDIWAVRADDPDKVVPGRIWTTEVVIGRLASERPRLSVRLIANTLEGELDIEPHAPGFLQQIVDQTGLQQDSYVVSTRAHQIASEADVDDLVEMLIDPSRRQPVFILSVPPNAENPNQPLIDPEALARATAGIGTVVILPDVFTWMLTERFGKPRSVFGGAVRAYLRGFSDNANPFAHRLVIADHLSTTDGGAQCVRWMRSLAATESIRQFALGRDVLTFAETRNASLKYKQQVLKSEGASANDQLDAANARIEALGRQLTEQAGDLDYFDAEHKDAVDRAEVAEEQARASTYRIQQLQSQLEDQGQNVDAELELPDAWSDLANWCDLHLSGRLVLSPAARHNARSPEFDDVQTAARCLLWLATSCRNRRLQGGEGSLREELVEAGIRNAHCGADQFDLYWQGQRYTADWHIKNGGNTRDPTRCLRIYYFWEPNTQQIVVADLPGHRRTSAS